MESWPGYVNVSRKPEHAEADEHLRLMARPGSPQVHLVFGLRQHFTELAEGGLAETARTGGRKESSLQEGIRRMFIAHNVSPLNIYTGKKNKTDDAYHSFMNLSTSESDIEKRIYDIFQILIIFTY
jgi:hypothetical protein